MHGGDDGFGGAAEPKAGGEDDAAGAEVGDGGVRIGEEFGAGAVDDGFDLALGLGRWLLLWQLRGCRGGIGRNSELVDTVMLSMIWVWIGGGKVFSCWGVC